jgi:hypothetical protein
MARTNVTCKFCGNVFPKEACVPAPSIRRNGAPAYICKTCDSHNFGYHAQPGNCGASHAEIGKPKKNGRAYGVEDERSYTDTEARLMYFEYGFIPTHDSSLRSEGQGQRYGYWDGNTCEYVSPIIHGQNILAKWVHTVDRLQNEGKVKSNSSCGTHLHISINNMQDGNGRKVYMDMIRRFYNSLFVELTNDMLANSEKVVSVFGRNFNHTYAMPITNTSKQAEHEDRYYWVNCMHDSNIEFRLNKFITGNQYMNLIKMETEMVETIIEMFCIRFNEKGDGKTREQTNFRKQIAKETGNELVRIWRKYW